MTSAQPKKKFTRAKAPRARTGCITCKIRHLKCDEEKPLCRRCQIDGHVCDGYQPIPKRRRPGPKNTRQLPPQLTSQASLILPRALISDISQLSTEVDLFHHVQTCTIEDLGTVLSPTEFWRAHALPRGHAVEPVKHALCALGAAHKLFKSQCLGTPAARRLEEASMQQYNRAIRHIKSFTHTASNNNLEVVLTCCVIFICIEILLGRYSESIDHLQAGGTILVSLHHISIPIPGETSKFEIRGDGARLFDDVARLLSLFAQDISLYTGLDVIPELYFNPKTTLELTEPTTSFPSSVAVAQALSDIESEYSAKIYLAGLEFQSLVEEANKDPSIHPRITQSELVWFEKLQTRSLDASFHKWSLRFDLFKSQIEWDNISKDQLRQIRSLSLEQAVWTALIDRESFEDDFTLEASVNILMNVEGVLSSEESGSEAVFSLSPHVLPAITMVCTSCNNPQIQQRCISLLRSMRRREGFWDSYELSTILDTILLAKERNVISWDGLPWYIPQLAQLASALNVQELQAPMASLSLAEKL